MDNNKKMEIIKSTVGKAKAKSIGDKMGVNWNKVDLDQFTAGINVEREHGKKNGANTNLTKDKDIPTAQIAWAHLKEIKKYYTGLLAMEKKYKEKQDGKY